MFKRRRAQSRIDRVRSIVWPDRGFRRLFSYVIQRIKRMPGSTLSIATGAAWGVAVSFTPFLGLHLLVGMMLAYLTRGNLLACLFATFIGNPWTFPLFFYLDYRVGAFIITEFGGTVKSIGDTLPSFMTVFIADPAALIGALFMPIVVGCLVLGTIGWFAGFGFTYWAVDGWRRHRVKRLAVARLRRAGLRPRNDNLVHEQTEYEPRGVDGSEGGKGPGDQESETGQ
ncbi:MAG: DUF2062 domain-containing protein [Candidatus Puniceispirillaceae bacterium]